MAPGTITTVSDNPANVAANARGTSHLQFNDLSGSWGVGSPLTLVCTITAKAALGGFLFRELKATDTP